MCTVLNWALFVYATVAFIRRWFALGLSQHSGVHDDNVDQTGTTIYFWFGRAMELNGAWALFILGANPVAVGFLLPYFVLIHVRKGTLSRVLQHLERQFGRIAEKSVVCGQDSWWCVDKATYDSWLHRLGSEVERLFDLVHHPTQEKDVTIIDILLIWYAKNRSRLG